MTQVKMVCFIEQTDYISCHLPKDAHSCQLLREIKKPTNPKAKKKSSNNLPSVGVFLSHADFQ